MSKKYFVFFIPLIALIVIGILSGTVYSLGHFKDRSGIGGTVEECNYCHEFDVGFYENPDPGYNLRWVKRQIEWPPGSGNNHSVNFTHFSGPPPGTYVSGPPSYNGPCEVCHTQTLYYRNNSSGLPHSPGGEIGRDCRLCHLHFADNIINYFEGGMIGSQSHITHGVIYSNDVLGNPLDYPDPKGPRVGWNNCTYCHDPDNFKLFRDSQPFEKTTVCDGCHSPDGNYDGVNDPVIGAKQNWVEGIYTAVPYGYPKFLKEGKEDWCAGCHDDGHSIIPEGSGGISAPNVMGDKDRRYGYKISGHGRNPAKIVYCINCHDPIGYDSSGNPVLHTDGNARTYSASLNNYKAGYRLNASMIIPLRNKESGSNAFRLCFNCHIYSEVFGPESNFRDDIAGDLYHEAHMDPATDQWSWDSDWDGTPCSQATGKCDSDISCPACHNVHGSPCLQGNNTIVTCPNPSHAPMIRHGELISTPGTTDKVPALRFNWYGANNQPTTDFLTSRWGGLLCGSSNSQPFYDISYNHVCWGCHPRGEIKYYRIPNNPQMVKVLSVWTTNSSGELQDVFAPGQAIWYHVTFTIGGLQSTYYVEASGTAKNISPSPPAYKWSKNLGLKSNILAPGEYTDYYIWKQTVPTSATRGSTAKVTVTMKMYKYVGGPFLNTQSRGVAFYIQ
jgi:hypothetical protein